jgi:hypothetical protein
MYTFVNKNKNIFGNTISNKDKIRVNSLEVHFSITRQYPEVGLKNNDILIYKNHLGRFDNITRPTHASLHNISKIQLKIKYGFGYTTDLGKMVFYFSCRN